MDLYNKAKIIFVVYILKHDPVLKKIIENREDIFSNINVEYYKLHNENSRIFSHTVYSYLMSDSYGEIFIEEMKKYPLFSDKHSIAFGILEYMYRKACPNRVKSIRMQEARNKLNLINDIKRSF